ncbi:hypothetical protein PsorP6_008175 [Peronosclerospora sorghi]|uniref:Uncharacterized protein n=1 Tax=Peronosclerospora sorghi TaxID=230839 RepID=A0ACC0W754_9STRA|nr:hypothetical protein PsorP6_008175 [Peronosclerospora sorghi]
MSKQSIQSQRLQRVYETTKNSLNVSTQVALVGGVVTPATIYQMDISFRSTKNKWSIARRYSDFYFVRRQLRKFVKQYKHQISSDQADGPAPWINLDRILEARFPRRHLRSDNCKIIAERKVALETYVQSLVEIISSIRVTAIDNAPDKTTNPAETKQLATLYSFLREFLEYPDKQIESEAKLKLAVLSIEDVVIHSRGKVLETEESVNNSECCSICLSDWDDTECADMNVVKLPCLHLFHEDCLLEWLHSNITCPVCREEPRTADAACSLYT